MADRIVLTGVTGFVGQQLAPFLKRQGYSVTGLSREDYGDLSETVDWQSVLPDNTDVIVHLAGRAHVMSEEPQSAVELYKRVNTDATKELALAALQKGVKRFVFISTVKVMGETGENLYPSSEGDPQDAYGISKHLAEAFLLTKTDQMDVVVLRPPLIYGPGVKGNFLMLLKLLNRRVPLPFAAVRNSRSMVSVDNFCDAIRHALTAQSGIYCVTDAEAVSTPDLCRLISNAMGYRSFLFPWPVSWMKGIAAMVGVGDKVDRLTQTFTVQNNLPGWRPPCDTIHEVEKTVAWFQDGNGKA